MYPDHNRRGRRNLILATILVIVLFGTDMVSGGLIRGPMRFAGAAVTAAVDAVFKGVFESGIFASKIQLANENRALREQVASLQEELAHATVSEQENAELRLFAHFASTTPGVSAPVISSFTASPYGTFLIGAGRENGIKQGDLVISAGGFVVGTVSDAQQKVSLVSEVFKAGSSVDAIAGDIPITLTGRGGGNAFGSAPRGSVIATGTPIVAPSLKHMPIGLVEHTEGDESSAAVKTYVRTPVNLLGLQLVYVEHI